MNVKVTELPELAYQKGRAEADCKIEDSGISDEYPDTRDATLLGFVDQGERFRDRAVMGRSSLWEHFGRGFLDRVWEVYGKADSAPMEPPGRVEVVDSTPKSPFLKRVAKGTVKWLGSQLAWELLERLMGLLGRWVAGFTEVGFVWLAESTET